MLSVCTRQQVATYLIIYRVADGTAWTKKTMEATMTTMDFNSRNGSAGNGNKRNQARRGRSLELTVDSSLTGINAVAVDAGAMESGELQEKIEK